MNCLAEPIRFRPSSAEGQPELVELLAYSLHDLRSRLHVIGSYASLSESELRGSQSDNSTREALAHIAKVCNETRNCQARITQISRLLRFGHGGAPVDEAPVDVADLLERVVLDRLPIAQARGLSLFAHYQDQLLFMVDVNRLTTLLENLVDNAIAATTEGVITVAGSKTAEGLVIEVADTGRGINSSEVERVFDPYWSESSEQGGSGGGLGLAICLLIVSDLSGELELITELGKGSCFRITFPTKGQTTPHGYEHLRVNTRSTIVSV